MVRRRTGLVLFLAVVLLVATAAYGVLAVDRPQVESVDNEWGAVTNDRTEVETRIGVDSPLLLRVGDAAADISYTVSMNDIEFATERENRVSLDGDESTVSVSTWLDNDEIPAWWVSHIKRNETTTVRVQPDVVVDVAGIRLPADGRVDAHSNRPHGPARAARDERESGVSGVRSDGNGRRRDERNVGNATANRTPIDASATVTNPTPIPVPITEIRYTVQLNGIVVGAGTAAERTVLEPDSTQSLEATAAIDNSRLDEWWVTHLRNDEASNLTVDFDATLESGGVERARSRSSSSRTNGRSRRTCSARRTRVRTSQRGTNRRGTSRRVR